MKLFMFWLTNKFWNILQWSQVICHHWHGFMMIHWLWPESLLLNTYKNGINLHYFLNRIQLTYNLIIWMILVCLNHIPFRWWLHTLTYLCPYNHVYYQASIKHAMYIIWIINVYTLRLVSFKFSLFKISLLSRNFFVSKYFPLTAVLNYLTYWVFYIKKNATFEI